MRRPNQIQVLSQDTLSVLIFPCIAPDFHFLISSMTGMQIESRNSNEVFCMASIGKGAKGTKAMLLVLKTIA